MMAAESCDGIVLKKEVIISKVSQHFRNFNNDLLVSIMMRYTGLIIPS